MSLRDIERRLARLERSKPTACDCPTDERHDFELLTPGERLQLLDLCERTTPTEPDPCQACGWDRAPLNFDTVTDLELSTFDDLLGKCRVDGEREARS